MRKIDMIVIHCSATPEGKWFDEGDIDAWHKDRGFNGIGYHYIITLDGDVRAGRPESQIGAHAKGYNSNSIGICYIGGMDSKGKKAKDTRTPEQIKSMDVLINELCSKYPIVELVGHRDLSPDLNGDGEITPNEWMKQCPSFEVRDRYQSFLKDTVIKP